MGKIIILSEKTDAITTDIMTWIMFYGKEVYRINRDDANLKILFMSKEYIKIKTSFGIIIINQGDYIWARRAAPYSIFVTQEENEELLQRKIFQFQEQKDIWHSVYWWLINHCKCCENPFSTIVNKINVLEIACKERLLVPDWILTSDKKELTLFVEKHKKVAAKAFNTLNYSDNGYSMKSLTNCITSRNLIQIPDFFDNLIFQKYIDKKYELRCFLFNEKLYTMAIFSQKDKKTRVDFRHYNDATPNRFIPFRMPKEYANKLKRVAKKLNLFSGSFDILVDKKDNYHFLEINPVGQFGMVSFPCNYYIDREIARYLIDQSKVK